MSDSYSTAGQLDPGMIGDDWILIIGGATRLGNRRSRRAAVWALAEGLDVVWFDGFEETDLELNQRVPLEGHPDGGTLVVIGCEEAEQGTLAGRLLDGKKWRGNAVSRVLWLSFLRRLGLAFRPRALWLVVRADVHALRTHPAPVAIVYGDDDAITSAWYAGRLWASTPIVATLPNRAT